MAIRDRTRQQNNPFVAVVSTKKMAAVSEYFVRLLILCWGYGLSKDRGVFIHITVSNVLSLLCSVFCTFLNIGKSFIFLMLFSAMILWSYKTKQKYTFFRRRGYKTMFSATVYYLTKIFTAPYNTDVLILRPFLSLLYIYSKIQNLFCITHSNIHGR